MQEGNPIGEGVQELIGRLHEEGVKSGKEEAKKILADAQAEAARILDAARKESQRIKHEADAHADTLQKAAHAALKIAVRDAVLTLKEQLQLTFEHHVQKLVAKKLGEEAFLEKMIGLIVQSALAGEERDAMQLLVGSGEMEAAEAERFVQKVAKTLLEKGISVGHEQGRGIRIRLVGEELEIDLSDAALAGLINRMIAPKYRAIFEGIGG